MWKDITHPWEGRSGLQGEGVSWAYPLSAESLLGRKRDKHVVWAACASTCYAHWGGIRGEVL